MLRTRGKENCFKDIMLECLQSGSVTGQGAMDWGSAGRADLPVYDHLLGLNQSIKNCAQASLFSICEMRTAASILSLFVAEELGDNTCNGDLINKQLSQTLRY